MNVALSNSAVCREIREQAINHTAGGGGAVARPASQGAVANSLRMDVAVAVGKSAGTG